MKLYCYIKMSNQNNDNLEYFKDFYDEVKKKEQAKKAYQKEYYEKNKEKFQQYRQEYREKNKNKIKQYETKQYTCECGAIRLWKHKKRHLKTKIHIKQLEAKQSNEAKENETQEDTLTTSLENMKILEETTERVK